MVTIASDNFDRAPGVLDGSTASDGGTWTARNLASSIAIVSNSIQPAINSGRNSYFHSAVPPTADYSVQLDVTVTSSGKTSVGIAGRIDTAGSNEYNVQWSGGNWYLQKIFSGSENVIGTPYSGDVPTTVKTAKLIMNGTAISVQINGVTRITATDPDITAAGKSGVNAEFAEVASSTGDNFSADTLPSGDTQEWRGCSPTGQFKSSYIVGY